MSPAVPCVLFIAFGHGSFEVLICRRLDFTTNNCYSVGVSCTASQHNNVELGFYAIDGFIYDSLALWNPLNARSCLSKLFNTNNRSFRYIPHMWTIYRPLKTFTTSFWEWIGLFLVRALVNMSPLLTASLYCNLYQRS